MDKQVEHEGTVASILGNSMVVHMVASSACGGCAAKSYCIPSENKDKDIRIESFSGDFTIGEKVKVIMQQSLGIKALCLGYVFPFFLSLITLLVCWLLTKNELLSGLSALLILLPYYLSLRLLNHKLEKTFRFEVRKIN